MSRIDTLPVIRLKDYRPPDYLAETVDMTFDLHPERTTVTARTTFRRNKGVAPGTDLRLDGDGLSLVSAALDGVSLPDRAYTATPDGLTVFKPPRRFTLEVVTEVNPAANTALSGLYRSGGNYCTQCEAEGFRRITYFPDRPDVLAVYTVRVEAPKDDAPLLLSNGNPVKKGRLAGGRHYAVWHDPHPKPSYLFALVAGDLGSLKRSYTTSEGRKVKLAIYVEKGKEERARYAMDALVRSMRWDEEVFGCAYDLDVFNIVAVPDFNMGAMENKGLNIFNDKYILADKDTATDTDFARIEAIIAHEYFHNWTGNRITCRDWFQLCLKEGLTVFRDQEFSADMRSRAVRRIEDVSMLRAHQFPEDAGPLAHPVRPDQYREINNFYTATVYEKGAELVRMLATLLGPKHFMAGMRRYLKKHDGEAATIEGFLVCFEAASKRDLNQFHRWYTQAGTPRLHVSTSHDKPRKRFTVEIEQSLAATPGQSQKKLFHMPVRIGLVGATGDITATGSTRAANRGDMFELVNRRHKIVFEGIGDTPVLSINRGFSSPVVVDYDYSMSELVFLARSDSDPFNRWQAMREAANRQIIAAMRAHKRRKKPKWRQAWLDAACDIACDDRLEPAFRAEMLHLPSEAVVAQAIGRNIDPDVIHTARKALYAALGEALEAARSPIMAGLRLPDRYRPDASGAGKRQLANLVLSLAIACGSDEAKTRAIRQFHNADNMTDREAAFSMILRLVGNEAETSRAIDAFYARYRDNHIVLDKWFQHQALVPGPRATANVRKLIRHEAFSWTNPNRMRSVIHSFAAGNPTGFNKKNGEGYRLVASVVKRLDRTNPQIAARLLTVFRSWRMLEQERRRQSKNALKSLAGAKDLSRDVIDILDRILA